MRKIIGLTLLLFLAFSSAFFIEGKVVLPLDTIEKVEAKVCPPGQHPYHGVDGESPGGVCKGSETISINANDSKLTTNIVMIRDIYNVVAGILLAISIIAIIAVAYIYISPFETTKVNGGGGKYVNIQDNTKAKMYLISIGLGIVLILSGFTIMNLIASLAGFQ
jgi:hypothetical protein